MKLNFQFCNLHFRLKKAYKENHSYKYPMFVWDLLPHAGASQIHPHMHGFLDTDRYQGWYIVILWFYMTCYGSRYDLAFFTYLNDFSYNYFCEKNSEQSEQVKHFLFKRVCRWSHLFFF